MARIDREDAIGLVCVTAILAVGVAIGWAIWTGWIYTLPAMRWEIVS